MAIGKAGAKNAAIFAVQILALTDKNLAKKLAQFKKAQQQKAGSTQINTDAVPSNVEGLTRQENQQSRSGMAEPLQNSVNPCKSASKRPQRTQSSQRSRKTATDFTDLS
jgi:hypothetical protein